MVYKERRMLTASEVAERLGVCRTSAYGVIRELNAEMEKRGCKTIAGRVSNDFFEERYFGSTTARGEIDNDR